MFNQSVKEKKYIFKNIKKITIKVFNILENIYILEVKKILF
jgi:hypothetical protein